jgi:glycine dehydrogenase
MTALYGIWHQPSGLKQIANRLRFRVEVLRDEFRKLGVKTITDQNNYFDTVVIDCEASGFSSSDFLLSEFHKHDINLRKVNEKLVGITINETTTIDDLADIIEIFA